MKNLGFKLWRWVGRKCGWYAGWMDFTPASFTQELKDMPPAYDPEMWTETKAVEKP